MNTLELEQGSDAWKAIRVGKVTASRVADVVAKTKSGWGASRDNYLTELVLERLTGNPAPAYVSGPMRWGTETEPQARAAYEFYHDCAVDLVGFVAHPDMPMAGASPDGLVGSDGMVEFKCPETKEHVRLLLKQTVPGSYVTQMQFQMACTGRQWSDFVSFDPRMPEDMRLFVQRVTRDQEAIDYLEKEVKAFIYELDVKVDNLKRLYGQKAAA